MATSAERKASFAFFLDEKDLGNTVRGELGRFISAEVGVLRDRNKTYAQNIQHDVLVGIKDGIRRKNVTTGRLLRATANSKNIFFAHTGLGVGNEEFMRTSVAKYWRTIELGSAETWEKRGFRTLELQGLWGGQLGGWYGRLPNGPWVSGVGKETGRRQGMYTPFSIGKGGGRSGLPIVNPKRDIRPMGAYLKAATKANLREKGIAEARDYIRDTLGRALVPAGHYTSGVSSRPLPAFDRFANFSTMTWD